MCEYNEMVHISDWYDVIIGGLTRINYEPDSDHSDIDVWGNIRCKCKGKQKPNKCDNSFPPRDELIMMRMCGNKTGNYSDGEKFFYSAYVRKGDWKLVVNGSNGVQETCTNLTSITDGAYLFDYIHANDTSYHEPDEDYWNIAYLPRFEKLGSTLATTLYYSECLTNYSQEDPPLEWNNPNNPNFMYDNELLYNIPNDRVEACAIQNNEAKKKELLDYLVLRSEEYSVPVDPYQVIIGSFRAQMARYIVLMLIHIFEINIYHHYNNYHTLINDSVLIVM